MPTYRMNRIDFYHQFVIHKIFVTGVVYTYVLRSAAEKIHF